MKKSARKFGCEICRNNFYYKQELYDHVCKNYIDESISEYDKSIIIPNKKVRKLL